MKPGLKNKLLNVLWFLPCGLVLSLLWSIVGILCYITIIGIPFGIPCFKIAKLMASPVGKRVELHFGKHPIVNTLWILFAGWNVALLHVILGVVFCVTIIGIPIGKQILKVAKLAFVPFGAEIVNI